jgi:hypothetical protein
MRHTVVFTFTLFIPWLPLFCQRDGERQNDVFATHLACLIEMYHITYFLKDYHDMCAMSTMKTL